MDDRLQLLKRRRGSGPRRQDGIVLVVALIVLVAVTIAGIGMMRSVDTATLVAGNLAFQQSATRAADKGIEAAIGQIGGRITANQAHVDDGAGYFGTITVNDAPGAGQSWQALWQQRYSTEGVAAKIDDPDYGNTIYYVAHRMCAIAQPAGSGGQCIESPRVVQSGGNSNDAGDIGISGSSQVYYRITVRVVGPRRTESYIQAHIAK